MGCFGCLAAVAGLVTSVFVIVGAVSMAPGPGLAMLALWSVMFALQLRNT